MVPPLTLLLNLIFEASKLKNENLQICTETSETAEGADTCKFVHSEDN